MPFTTSNIQENALLHTKCLVSVGFGASQVRLWAPQQPGEDGMALLPEGTWERVWLQQGNISGRSHEDSTSESQKGLWELLEVRLW